VLISFVPSACIPIQANHNENEDVEFDVLPASFEIQYLQVIVELLAPSPDEYPFSSPEQLTFLSCGHVLLDFEISVNQSQGSYK